MADKSDLTGKFYDIQGFSVQDGPGIRLTLFLKGCPLRCLWCHSPESQSFRTELNWMEMKCVGTEICGKCLAACPEQAISSGEKREPATGGAPIATAKVAHERCTNCGLCAAACAPKALYMCGADYTVEEVMAKIRRDVPFYKKSGGGVTVSGGECLCQPAFLLAMLKQCKSEGIHTAVDTTGFADWDVIEPILPYTDLFLYDLKHMDSEKHKQATGVPNERILENARRIAKAGGRFHVRIPIIPMYNESERDFEAFGEFISELGGVDVVQLLPYHKLGVAKWNRLFGTGPVLEAAPPKDELVEARKKQLEAFGLTVAVH
jgi:pyruvate formate lyase activating enzyme